MYDYGFDQKQYNGNIAAIRWGSIGMSSEPEKQRAYRYSYDRMNRLTAAQYLGKATSWVTKDAYSVSNLAYDLNGNIKSLKRNDQSGGVMDNLSYDYTNRGNQLSAVTDNGGSDEGFADGHTGSGDYFYDQNGNLTKDLNKKISSIAYNYLNLPAEVVIDGKGTIKYTYDAAGTKLRQEVLPSDGSPADGSPNKTTDYVSGFHYTDGTLDFVQHEEGQLMIKDGLAYHYDLKDHLGNTRVTFSNVPVTTTNTASMEASAAPVVNRFASKYAPLSPYNYAANNPILLIDVNGDSLDISSITSNKMMYASAKMFAQSKDGLQFLSQFAKKGQTAFGHTFEKDGAFHKEGINLSINAKSLGKRNSVNGQTDFEMTESGFNININLNSDLNSEGPYSSDAATTLESTINARSRGEASFGDVVKANEGFWFDRLKTLTHESYQHAERFASDYSTGGASLLNSQTKRAWGLQHHSLEGPNNMTNYRTKGQRILQSANSKLGLQYTREQIINIMY